MSGLGKPGHPYIPRVCTCHNLVPPSTGAHNETPILQHLVESQLGSPDHPLDKNKNNASLLVSPYMEGLLLGSQCVEKASACEGPPFRQSQCREGSSCMAVVVLEQRAKPDKPGSKVTMPFDYRHTVLHCILMPLIHTT